MCSRKSGVKSNLHANSSSPSVAGPGGVAPERFRPIAGCVRGGGQARCWQGQRRGDGRTCVRVCARACGRRGRCRSSAVRYAGRCRCAGAAVQVGGRLGIRGASSGSGLLQGLFHVRILGAPRDRTMHASGKAASRSFRISGHAPGQRLVLSSPLFSSSPLLRAPLQNTPMRSLTASTASTASAASGAAWGSGHCAGARRSA